MLFMIALLKARFSGMADYKKKLLKIFIPLMLSSLISQLQMMIDRIFLGRLDILYMSAVGNAMNPVWTTMSFVFSLSIGASILVSQAVGEKNLDKAKEITASLVKFHNIVPFVLFLFWMFFSKLVFELLGVTDPVVMKYCITYARIYSPVFLIIGLGSSYTVILQTSNYTKPLAIYSAIRSAANIILDWLLIFGNCGFPRMEIAGAALGTTIAEFVGAVYLGYYVISRRKKFLTGPGIRQILSAKIIPYLKSVKLGINAALEDLLWNVGNLCIIRILNSINSQAAGIYSMVFTVEVLFVVVFCAIGNGVMTLTGEATGAKDLTLYRRVVGTSVRWSCYVAGSALIISSIWPKIVLGLFTTNQAVIDQSVIYVILVCVNMFGKLGNIIVGNGIRGYGDTKWMLMTQIIGTVQVVVLACLFVFVFKFGMLGVFFAVIADELLRSIINTIRFFRIKF